MYRKILIPTDGSALSKQAVKSAISFARNLDATAIGVYVAPESSPDPLEAWAHHDPAYATHRNELHEKFADEALTFVANCALAEGVPCVCKTVSGSEPCRAIIEVADQTHCDLIFIASHGWQGNADQLSGSETLKVVTHSKVPVLVHKPEPETA